MTLRLRLYLQFGLAVLPLLLLLAYQATTRGDLPQRVSGALDAYDLALAGHDGYKDFLAGVADAIDTGRLGNGALEALERARDRERALAGQVDAAAPLAEGFARVARAARANPALATFVPMKAELQSLRAASQELLEQRRAALTALVQEERDSASHRDRVAIAGIAGAAAVLLFMAFVLRRLARGITDPLDASVKVARAIASGRLDNAVAAHGDDEVGRLLAAVGAMQAHLAQLVREVRERAHSVAAGAAHVSRETGALSRRNESQAASLEQAAASMEELGGAVRENNASAQHADRLAREAAEAALAGQGAVDKFVATMGEIGASSKRIGDIIAVIDAVAFQTNILALNAAVEAARAGEQGRGFAVVATEVRALAQRCATASAEIRQVIGASARTVEEGTSRVDDAGRTIASLASGVHQVSRHMAEIAGATRQQERGIEQVGASVSEMDHLVQQNAAASNASAAAAERLRRDAEALAEAVSRFTLPDDLQAIATSP